MIKPRHLTILLITSCACLAEAEGNKEVYKIVDEAGRVIYTDTPPAEERADQLELPPINQMPVSRAAEPEVISADESLFAGYSMVDLVAPQDDSLIHFDQQNIIVQLALTPELQAGHFVQFYLDGAAYGRPLAATSYAIGNLQRGSHRVSARVVTAGGETVANSQSVKVHVQRHFKRN
jgi:hypothetical protein